MIPSLIFCALREASPAPRCRPARSGCTSVLPRRSGGLRTCCTDRLLDQDILAGLNGPDRLQRVVKVRRRNRHGVDALVVEQLPEVRVGRRPLLARRFDRLAAGIDDRLIDVAERRDLDVWHLQVRGDVCLAPTVESDDRDPHCVVRTLQRTGLERRWQRDRAHQEVPAIDCAHRLLLLRSASFASYGATRLQLVRELRRQAQPAIRPTGSTTHPSFARIACTTLRSARVTHRDE